MGNKIIKVRDFDGRRKRKVQDSRSNLIEIISDMLDPTPFFYKVENEENLLKIILSLDDYRKNAQEIYTAITKGGYAIQ